MDQNYIFLSRNITLLHPDVQIECQDVPNDQQSHNLTLGCHN